MLSWQVVPRTLLRLILNFSGLGDAVQNSTIGPWPILLCGSGPRRYDSAYTFKKLNVAGCLGGLKFLFLIKKFYYKINKTTHCKEFEKDGRGKKKLTLLALTQLPVYFFLVFMRC